MSHIETTLGELIQAVTIPLEAAGVQLHKRSVSDTEYCFYTFDGREGRLAIEHGQPVIEGSLFEGIKPGPAIEAHRQRIADEAARAAEIEAGTNTSKFARRKGAATNTTEGN